MSEQATPWAGLRHRLFYFLLLLTTVATLLGACAHGGGSRGVASGLSAPSPGPRRMLYRVQYQGPHGSGSLRLALLYEGRQSYQIRTSDLFGRALWSLALRGSRAHFLDHRRREFCVTEDEVRIPELALAPLPLLRLPEILMGGPPTEIEGQLASAGEIRDFEGRSWTVRFAEGVVVAWTLWEEDQPLLWWKRQDRGGILSHRQGSQFRWRQRVSEMMSERLGVLEAPPDYSEVDCRRLTREPTG